MNQPRPKLLLGAGIATAIVLLLAMAGAAARTAASFHTMSDLVLHTQEVRQELAHTLLLVTEVETGARGFVLTGDERLLESFQRGTEGLPEQVVKLRRLTNDNPSQLKRLEDLIPVLELRVDRTRQAVETRRATGQMPIVQSAASAAAKELMDRVRALIGEMDAEEARLLELRLGAAREQARSTLAFLGIGLALDVLLVGGIFFTVRRHQIARDLATAELRRRSDEISDLYNNAPCGYHSIDADGRIQAINDTELAWLGYTREEVIGRNIYELLTPSSQELMRVTFPAFKESGSLRDLQIELVHKNGRSLPVTLNATATRDKRGGFLTGRCTISDATERLRIERVTTQARAYAESIVDTVREPLVILTEDLRFNSANRAFYEMFRTSPDAIVGQPFAAFGGGWWDIPELVESLQRIIPEHTTLDDFKLTRDFGSLGRKIFLINARKLYRPGNNTTMTLVAIEDITARREAEEERELFFTLSLDLLCISEFSGKFRRVNPAFTETLGWTPEEMTTRPFLDFIHPDDHEATLAEVRRQAGGTAVMSFENRFQCKDGSYRWLAWKSVPAPELGLMFATARDVTDRRAAEEKITRLNGELREHTGELERANRELEAFSYSVSHDLRAPVRHVAGFAALLQRHAGPSLDERGRHLLNTIENSGRRMGLLIDGLLAFARIGRTELQRRPVRLNEMVREVQQQLQPETAGRVVRWEVGSLPNLVGDAILLRQVFENLLGNAVKYTRGKPEAVISVHALPSDPAQGEVVICVRDNGAGFDMQYVDKLFGVFSRLHTDKEFEGTGVGLANVQRIVHRHGGRCWAEGKIGEGAAFYVSLPLA